MKTLKILNLSNNRIEIVDANTFNGLLNVVVLELQHNDLVSFQDGLFQHLIDLNFLNLSGNHIQTVYGSYEKTALVNLTCDLRGNPLKLLNPNFETVTFFVDEYSSCCFTGASITCLSANGRPSFLTCKRLLANTFIRLAIWFVGLMIILFNVYVIFNRSFSDTGNKVQNILIWNLGLSDLLMGIDLVILTSVDMYYAEYFPAYSSSWIKGPL